MPIHRTHLFISLLYLVHLFNFPYTIDAGNIEEYLKSLEKSGYDRDQPPEEIELKKGPIVISVQYNRIHHMDDASGHLSILALIIKRWLDDRIAFNHTSKFDAVKRLPKKSVWEPEIDIFNAIRNSYQMISRDEIWVMPWGGVVTFLQQVVHISCIPDLRKFPFDTQECGIALGLWTRSREHINIQGFVREPDPNGWIIKENPRWHMHSFHTDKSVQMINDVSGEHSRSAMVFRFKMDRKNSLLPLGILTPMALSTVVGLITFFLADYFRPRLFLAVSSFIVMVILITTISLIVPVNRNGVPLIVTYGALFLVFGFLTLFHTILFAILHSLDIAVPSKVAEFFEHLPPIVLKIFVLPVSTSKSFFPWTFEDKAAKNIPVRHSSNDSSHVDTHEMSTLSQGTWVPDSPPYLSNIRKWGTMVKVFDGLCFRAYLLTLIGLMISMVRSFQEEEREC